MDINSLLSPQESPSHRPDYPHPLGNAVTDANPSRGHVASYPDRSPAGPVPPGARNGFTYPQASTSSPTLVSPSSMRRGHASLTPPMDAGRLNRQSSTTGMDTLADLASMQHHQQITRDNRASLHGAGLNSTRSPPTKVTTNTHIQSSSPSGATRNTSRETTDPRLDNYTPSVYATTALSEGEVQIIAELDEYLKTNPHAYDSHVRLVKLLHKGFVSHIQSNIQSPPAPQAYDLLPHLHRARETMNGKFAIGEELWMDWIEDQKILARTLDDILGIVELCKRSVEQEQASSRLWFLYADWMLRIYRIANPHDPILKDLDVPSAATPELSDEDLVVARASLSWQQVLDVWSQGVQATMWRMNDSNVLWDRYTEMLLHQYAQSPERQSLEQLKSHFSERLGVPHATWDQTFSTFSTFISAHDNAHYVEAMVQERNIGSVARDKYSLREPLETDLVQVQQQGDHDAEWRAYIIYIDWELSQSRSKGLFDFDLTFSLYQRACLRFPSDPDLWEGLLMLLNDEYSARSRQKVPVLSILDLATQHCPWSGSLWSLYLVTAEREARPFSFMEQIKHQATRTGTLDAGGLEEVIKVHTTWGGVLRRRAFWQGATEEDLDIAEVGIRSAIEDMENLGRFTYGNDYQGDPAYRLERIYIRYLTQRHNWSAARETWRRLVPRLGNTYEFWLRYYLWEMGTYSKVTYREDQPDIRTPKPTEATNVLRQALKRPKLDWPERILEIFRTHCEDFEDAQELQLASVLVWKTTRAIRKRRELEQNQGHASAQQAYAAGQEMSSGSTEGGSTAKRKREVADSSNETPVKKSKPDLHQSVEVEMTEQSQAVAIVPKRDRENATVVVSNLPLHIHEVKLRQFFRDCGTINKLQVQSDGNGESSTATIEFESKEDVAAAQTRDMKMVDGRPVAVRVTGQTSIFVTNFPAAADELYIRELFSGYGKIMEVRFPSLKFDTHRRFCYVEFSSPSEAQAALVEDGHRLDDQHVLLAKMSDPTKKKARTGALYDGREIYICNLEWSATESDLRRLFAGYGPVEKVRIPVKVNGQSKGIAFVEFSAKVEAEAALSLNGAVFKGRPLNIEIATDTRAKRQAATIIKPVTQSSLSPVPSSRPDREGSIVSAGSQPSSAPATASQISSRTIALLGVPDTVNDTRIRGLAEPYGGLIKVVLRPDHQGAIVEYDSAASAGKAIMGLDGHEIAPGRRLSTGTVPQLLRRKAESKSDRVEHQGTATSIGGPIQPSAMPIRRPGPPAPRRGGRGGLGLKTRGAGLGGPRAAVGESRIPDAAAGPKAAGEENVRASTGKPKSNADFQAMLSH